MKLNSTRLRLLVPVLAALVLAPAGVAQAQDAPDRLAAMARSANTPQEHAAIAKRYRLQAESFDTTAAQHEARADRLARSQPGIAHKWPSMAPRTLSDAKRQALEARRAAHESRLLAERHITLSVEAQAAD